MYNEYGLNDSVTDYVDGIKEEIEKSIESYIMGIE